MSHSVTMPALGESVTEGTVTRWLKQEGEEVAVDEPLLEVSTDKVDTEIPSPAAGVLQKILVGEDETVEVGAELAVIGDGAGDSGGDGVERVVGRRAAGAGDEQRPAGGAAAAGRAGRSRTSGGPAGRAAAQQDEQPQQASRRSRPAAVAAADRAAGEQPATGPGGGGDQAAASGTSVTMPALGESVTEGTVTRWLKQEGEQVETDEPLLEVSTDKVDTEIPSPASGTLTKILVGEDETVEVGAQLAVIGGGGGSAQQEQPPSRSSPPSRSTGPAGAARPGAGSRSAARRSSRPSSPRLRRSPR